jgi:hypothetical protein
MTRQRRQNPRRNAPNQPGMRRRATIRPRIPNRATIRRRVQNQRRNNLNLRKATRLLVLNLRILSRPGMSMIALRIKTIRVS